MNLTRIALFTIAGTIILVLVLQHVRQDRTICCVAGKSGGHIIPCLTLAKQDQTTHGTSRILFFSSNTPLDKKILAENEAVNWHIILALSTRSGSMITTIMHAFSSFISSFFYLCKHRPEKIITTGGIVALPPCLAGFLLRIPITLYSLDAVPWKAIQALAPLATDIVVSFSSSQKYFPHNTCIVEPYPIKYQHTDKMTDTHTARAQLGLSPDKKTVVALGGSQGSAFINECMKQWIADPSFSKDTIQIIHQTGSDDPVPWINMYQTNDITAYVVGYAPDLALMYAAADLIICRAGAGTLFEVKFFNKKCIIIPLTTDTTTHQVDNARAMSGEYPELFQMISQDNVEKNMSLLFQFLQSE
jgi:UDP-N-acetylglucosamine--N-acetylmuramyl-(pentapeptide) pyrophosphoryl-undecaprenol N-acetylglucosamine transferase